MDSSAGEVIDPLDEGEVFGIIDRLREEEVEAVGVCLLWSTANPVHEDRIGALLDERLPGVSYTLSHALNPILREYRRASSACIDASLKPIMSRYIGGLQARLKRSGFRGRLLMLTSKGGVMDAEELARAPIHTVGSGPSMAPIAGRHYSRVDARSETAIVADTGGTTYDVSLVRRGVIPMSPETMKNGIAPSAVRPQSVRSEIPRDCAASRGRSANRGGASPSGRPIHASVRSLMPPPHVLQ